MFDVLIKGAMVLDGAGTEAFPADVGISGGKIEAVGELGGAGAGSVIRPEAAASLPGSSTYTGTRTRRCSGPAGARQSLLRA